LPEPERQDLLGNYYKRLTDPDAAVHRAAGVAWSRYETGCSNLIPRADKLNLKAIGGVMAALALARIEAHYFINDLFMSDSDLLDNVHRLHNIPGVIVQGRYDMVCPIATADSLSRKWPQTTYVIVPDAGHSAMETGIRKALVRATEAMKGRIS
jgi:proline iminopeptidase